MPTSSRRTFIKATLSGLALSGVSGAAQNEKVRHAVIGVGGQGRHHAQGFASFDDCEVVAVCDIDPSQMAKALERLPDPQRVQQFDDFRRLLEDKTIDSVSVATPDHWQTPISLAAILAGKHVYVEKPCAHNIHEVMVLKEAAAKSGLCVQHGTQARSSVAIKQAVEFMRGGGIGKVRMAKAINHQLREPIGRAPESAPPAGVNYDLWLGPAPVRAFTKNRWHYQWRWFWDYGCGDIGNDGIHQIDQARWGLGVGLPNAVSASGGQLFYDDDHETPDTQVVTYEYDNCYLLYEMRLWTDYPLEGHDNGAIFYGDNGKLEIGRKGCDVILKGGETKHLGAYGDIKDHFRNFLDCVKAGKPDGLNGPIVEAMPSASLCHLGNIAMRVGRRLRLDPQTGQCIDDTEANKMFAREYRKGYELPV